MKNHEDCKHLAKAGTSSASYDLDRFFDEVLGSFEGMFGKDMHPLSHSIPKVNIWENGEQYALELAAPGWEKSDFSIELERETLIISTSHKPSQEEQEQEGTTRFIRREFAQSALKRSFQLPEDVDKSRISAKYEKGVLSVSLPKIDRKEWVKSVKVE